MLQYRAILIDPLSKKEKPDQTFSATRRNLDIWIEDKLRKGSGLARVEVFQISEELVENISRSGDKLPTH